MNGLRAFRSVGEAAATARDLFAEGQPLSQVWRFAIVQLLDDYRSIARYQGISSASSLWQVPPPSTGDTRIDAAFAALAEYLARQDGWPVPIWARDTAREAIPWWFVTTLRGMHPRAMLESPPSFRRRGVFITSDALERV